MSHCRLRETIGCLSFCHRPFFWQRIMKSQIGSFSSSCGINSLLQWTTFPPIAAIRAARGILVEGPDRRDEDSPARATSCRIAASAIQILLLQNAWQLTPLINYVGPQGSHFVDVGSDSIVSNCSLKTLVAAFVADSCAGYKMEANVSTGFDRLTGKPRQHNFCGRLAQF